MQALYRPSTCTTLGVIVLSLSGVTGGTLVLVTGSAQTLSFTATDVMAGACGPIKY